jgi:hypothetical protein
MNSKFVDDIPNVPTSGILLPKIEEKEIYSISQLIHHTTSFYDCNDIAHKPDLLHGLTKSSTAFSIETYIKSILLLIQGSLIQENQEQTTLIKSYFDGMCKMIDLLKVMDLNVAENRILADNIGYILSSLKRVYKPNNKNE